MSRRYARVLLHAIYLDQVDLSLISRTGCGGLGEAQALAHTGRVRPSPLEEAMELYQIGRFLELDILSQGCEDLILEWLSLETLPTILQWSRQPHGSCWVHRQVTSIKSLVVLFTVIYFKGAAFFTRGISNNISIVGFATFRQDSLDRSIKKSISSS